MATTVSILRNTVACLGRYQGSAKQQGFIWMRRKSDNTGGAAKCPVNTSLLSKGQGQFPLPCGAAGTRPNLSLSSSSHNVRVLSYGLHERQKVLLQKGLDEEADEKERYEEEMSGGRTH